MQLGILDPGTGLDKAQIELAYVARPIAERPPVGIEQPGSDHDLMDNMAGEAGAVEQQRNHARWAHPEVRAGERHGRDPGRWAHGLGAGFRRGSALATRISISPSSESPTATAP